MCGRADVVVGGGGGGGAFIGRADAIVIVTARLSSTNCSSAVRHICATVRSQRACPVFSTSGVDIVGRRYSDNSFRGGSVFVNEDPLRCWRRPSGAWRLNDSDEVNCSAWISFVVAAGLPLPDAASTMTATDSVVREVGLSSSQKVNWRI